MVLLVVRDIEFKDIKRAFEAAQLDVSDCVHYLRQLGMSEREAVRTVERWMSKLEDD